MQEENKEHVDGKCLKRIKWSTYFNNFVFRKREVKILIECNGMEVIGILSKNYFWRKSLRDRKLIRVKK